MSPILDNKSIINTHIPRSNDFYCLKERNREADLKKIAIIGISLIATGCCGLVSLSQYLQNYLKIH